MSAENSARYEGGELPDADAAMPPDYWLLAREWRTAGGAIPPVSGWRPRGWRPAGEYVAARRALRTLSRWPQGDGHPVLVLPGFLAGAPSTQFLRQVLRRLGYRAYDWRLGYNLGGRASLAGQRPAPVTDTPALNDGRSVSPPALCARGTRAPGLARAPP